MSGFVRREVLAAVWQWREVAAGLPVFAFGLWLAVVSFGALFLIGCGLAAVGAALTLAGFQRGRFRGSEEAAGVVQVDERRITYFGPYDGGAMAVDDITDIAVDPSRTWVLRDIQNQTLLIPMGAKGAEALFDAFTTLPGLTGRKVVEAREQAVSTRRTIWQKPHARLH